MKGKKEEEKEMKKERAVTNGRINKNGENIAEECHTSPYPHAKCNAVRPSESSSSLFAPEASAFFKP